MSSWDEPVTLYIQPTSTADDLIDKDYTWRWQLQLIATIVVLLLVLGVALALAFVLSGISSGATPCCSRSRRTVSDEFQPNLYTCNRMKTLNKIDISGDSILTIIETSFNGCCENCLNTTDCLSFSWHLLNNFCHRYRSVYSNGSTNEKSMSATF